MSDEISNSKVDRLGERLRSGELDTSSISLLDQYCRSFTTAYEAVLLTLRDQLKLSPSGRPQKSTRSIIEKLRRDRIMLSRMQDIAGCRIVLPDIAAQNEITNVITEIQRFIGVLIFIPRIL